MYLGSWLSSVINQSKPLHYISLRFVKELVPVFVLTKTTNVAAYAAVTERTFIKSSNTDTTMMPSSVSLISRWVKHLTSTSPDKTILIISRFLHSRHQ